MNDYTEMRREFLLARYRRTMPPIFELCWGAFVKAGHEPPIIVQALRDHLVNMLKPEMELMSADVAETVPPILRQVLDEWLAGKERGT